MKRRILAAFMSLCLLAGVLGYPGSEKKAQAATITTPDGLWNVEVGRSSPTAELYAQIWKYNGSATEIVIPDTIVDSSVSYPVKYLYQSMFSNDVRAKLVSVTIPGTVKKLPNSLFKEAVCLTHITLPEGLETLELYVFRDCTALSDVRLPNSLTTISEGAFYNCTALERITISSGVTYFSGTSFRGCTNLKEVTVDEKNPSYTSVDGVVYSKDMTTLVYYPPAKPFTGIPDSVTKIGAGAFLGHQTLSDITLSDKTVSIGASAFGNCQGLTKFHVPDGVTKIGDSAFSSCKNLAEIYLPDTITSMGEYALSGCDSLTSVQLPKKLTVLRKGFFNGCDGLEEVGWPENLTKLEGSCFMSCSSLTALDIPDSVTEIDYDNFIGCHNLNAIHLPKNLKTLGTCVFAMTWRIPLESIIFPEGTINLGQSMFSGSSGIKFVVIPRSIENFDYTKGTHFELGFWGNPGSSALSAIYLCYKDSSAEKFAIEHDIPYEIIGETYHVEGDYIYTIKEDGTVKILSYAGADRTLRFPEKLGGRLVTEYEGSGVLNYNVTGVVLPKGMTSIKWEFDNFAGLSEITIPESVTDFEDCSFRAGTDITIKGVEGSPAQAFAEEAEYRFVPVSPELWEEHTHSYQGEVTGQATCTEPGVRTYTCTGCDDSYTEPIPASGHTVVADAAVEPTETTEGKTAGSHCGVCGAVLKRQETVPAKGPEKNPDEGTEQNPEKKPEEGTEKDPVKNPEEGTEKEHVHDYTDSLNRASFLTDGSTKKVCRICSAVKETTVIYCPKTIRFDTNDYIYNGKVRTPSVKVKDSKGTLLKANRDYTVSYEAGRKNPGKYQVTIEFKGNYESRVTKSFTIRPKGTKLKKLKAKSKGFVATWKKNVKQTDGYQIQYCVGGDFAGGKVKTFVTKKNTVVKKKFTGLKKKKKYYVRIWTYKKVQVNGSSKTLYSDWSNTKTVRTKK